MPTQSGCTLCGGNDHERSSCSWNGAPDCEEAFKAAFEKACEEWNSGIAVQLVRMMWQAGSAWQRAQSAPAVVECCTPSAEQLELLRKGEYTPEELWGGPRPTCPKCINSTPQPAPQQGDEVRRLREALERATKLLSAAAAYATKMEPMPAKLLNAIDVELDASTVHQGVGERT